MVPSGPSFIFPSLWWWRQLSNRFNSMGFQVNSLRGREIIMVKEFLHLNYFTIES